MDNEEKTPTNESYQELWCGKKPSGKLADPRKTTSQSMAGAPEGNLTLLEEMLTHDIEGRGRPKALCYEDVTLMVVRHPDTGQDVLAMSIKFIHYKGSDNEPKP